MRKTTLFLISLSLVLLVLVFKGWRDVFGTPATAPEATAQVISNVPQEPFELFNVDLALAQSGNDDFNKDLQKLIDARDFEGLDMLASRFRATQERFIGGGWKIHSFYKYLSAPTNEKATDKKWAAWLEFLKTWKKARPQSVPARGALASAYIQYAWFARGSGFSYTVRDAEWAEFHKRIDLAVAEIKSIANPGDDPYGYFENLLVIAKAQSWNRGSLGRFFEEAIQYDPTYQYFYCEMAVNLLPRWGGEPGEWEQFAEQVKTSIGGDDGLTMYYLIAMEITDYHPHDFFDKNRVSWTDMKKGFLASLRKRGTNPYRLNQFAAVAFQAHDPQVVCKSFAKISSDYFNSDIWKGFQSYENTSNMVKHMCMMPRADNMVKDPTPLPPKPKMSPKASTDTYL